MKRLITKSIFPVVLISSVSVIVAYLIGMLAMKSENTELTFSLLSVVFIIFIPIFKLLFKRLVEHEFEEAEAFKWLPYFLFCSVLAIASTFAFDYFLGSSILENISRDYGSLLINEIETTEILNVDDRTEIMSLPFLLQTYIVHIFFIVIGVFWSVKSLNAYWKNIMSNKLELAYAK